VGLFASEFITLIEVYLHNIVMQCCVHIANAACHVVDEVMSSLWCRVCVVFSCLFQQWTCCLDVIYTVSQKITIFAYNFDKINAVLF